jgi:hypothetical protein
MGRLIKYSFYLCILGLIGLIGYSYFGDLTAPTTLVTQPLALE